MTIVWHRDARVAQPGAPIVRRCCARWGGGALGCAGELNAARIKARNAGESGYCMLHK